MPARLAGKSHFRIRIVAEAFRGISSVARHRLIYAAVDDLMKTDIHALAIEALPPDSKPLLTENLVAAQQEPFTRRKMHQKLVGSLC